MNAASSEHDSPAASPHGSRRRRGCLLAASASTTSVDDEEMPTTAPTSLICSTTPPIAMTDAASTAVSAPSSASSPQLHLFHHLRHNSALRQVRLRYQLYTTHRSCSLRKPKFCTLIQIASNCCDEMPSFPRWTINRRNLQQRYHCRINKLKRKWSRRNIASRV